MARFPLPAELASIHDDAIAYAAVIQNSIAARGGCRTLSSEALNVLAYNAILTHRSVRTLCEGGWTPITAPLNRTLLDIFANCVATVNQPATAEYMGFKYLSHFYRIWLTDPQITNEERAEATTALDMMVAKLQPGDQTKAQLLRAEARPTLYWFQPEFANTRAVLELSAHPIYDLYRFYSGSTHGGFAGKIFLNDDPRSEDIEPREHPRNAPKAVVASTRLLIEICYVRDHWDNGGVGDYVYDELVGRIARSC